MKSLSTDVTLLYESPGTKDDAIQTPDAEYFLAFINDDATIEFLSQNLGVDPVVLPSIHTPEISARTNWESVGAASLQLFVAYNWLGFDAPLAEPLKTFLAAKFTDPDGYLELPDETFKKLVNKELLCVAKYCLLSDEEQELKGNITLIWELRYLVILQLVVDEPLMNIYKRIKRDISSLEHFIDVGSHLKMRLLRTQISVEIAQILLWYREVTPSKLFIENAMKFCGLEVELTGALGMRTHFQEKATSQLMIQVDRKNEEKDILEKRIIYDNPKNLELGDDTVMNKIKFVEPNKNTPIQLFEEEEALLLALACHLKRAGAFGDDIVKEELATYVEYILATSSVWSIRFKALTLRSLLDRDNRRKCERSMVQLEHLVNATKSYSKDNRDKLQNKLSLFYATLLDPAWITEKHLADILLLLGCTKSALDVYERLQLWKDMIICYHKLDRKHHAEAIVREQLAVKESPYLWTLLGDATADISHYHTAWTMSNEKYYKAQTALGDFYFDRKEYTTCIDHYQKSLKLNSLQVSVWQRLGYACLDSEQYEASARAYRRFNEFEQDIFESWNNLSKAYIKLGDKKRAYHTLQEAIKCNYEEWRLWENFLVVSVDIGSFEETIITWHRLIELKGKYEDDEVMEILVNAVCDDVGDFKGNGAGRLSKKLLALMARITGTGYSTPRFWLAYAKLLEHTGEDVVRIVDCIQKSNRSAILKPKWEKDPESVLQVLNHNLETLRLCLQSMPRISDDGKRQKTSGAFRLSFNSVLRTAETSISSWDSSKPNVQPVVSALTVFKELLLSLPTPTSQ